MSAPQKPDGFRAWLLTEDFSSPGQARAHQAYVTWLRFSANPLALGGLTVVVLLALAAWLAPWVSTHNPFQQDLARALLPPSGENWLGTDELGRDVYSRLVYGARTTLYIAILVTVIVGPIGFIVGAAAGYIGGLVDTILMRVTDIFLAFPSLVLALAFSAALGPGIENAVIAIALTVWPPVARLVRAETLTFRKADFVVAAELQGASVLRIMFRYIVPLCAPSVVIRLTLNMASIILTAAGLGFLGLGA
jgi:peptide/nickel transport system permease protein